VQMSCLLLLLCNICFMVSVKKMIIVIILRMGNTVVGKSGVYYHCSVSIGNDICLFDTCNSYALYVLYSLSYVL